MLEHNQSLNNHNLSLSNQQPVSTTQVEKVRRAKPHCLKLLMEPAFRNTHQNGLKWGSLEAWFGAVWAPSAGLQEVSREAGPSPLIPWLSNHQADTDYN